MAPAPSLSSGSAPEALSGGRGVVSTSASALWRLRHFVSGLGELLDAAPGEPIIIERGTRLLSELVAQDDWLPAEFARPSSERYQQYLLHCDSRERFSVVSFVWGPGQQTPIHDHRVWGLVGVLRGSEYNQGYVRSGGGQLVPSGARQRLAPGSVSAVSPSIGDLHRVENADCEGISISIHVYGGNIGAVHRATYDEAGVAKPFISGYANTTLPNIWQAARGA